MPILILLFVIPFAASLALVGISFLSDKLHRLQKGIAFILSLIPLVLLVVYRSDLMKSDIHYAWIPQLSVNFSLSIDPLSEVFLYLTSVIIPISILTVDTNQNKNPSLFFSLILLLQGLLIGFFNAKDLVLFTIFWESMLLPLYFIITLWGGDKRRKAALKFLVYMIAGSAFMIAGVLFLYFAAAAGGTGTFNMESLQDVSRKMPYASFVFAAFLLAFAVKTPLFPFHAWLPDAYCQAPTAGTILLAALLSKAGIYGIARIGLGIFPFLLKEWGPVLLTLAIIGVFYGGLAAWVQKDFKRLIAYSSFSHVNFILAGLFIWHQPAQEGAILQALNHGITITGLFLVSGWLEGRLRTTSIVYAGGLAKYLPNLCWLTMIFVLSSIALPGTNNFIGELMILFGLFGQNPWTAAILGLSVILSVIYMLRFMQKIYFGSISGVQSSWTDIGIKEIAIATPLVLIILWMGLYPSPVLKEIKPAIENIAIVPNGEPSR